jgi:glycosyltransferase involved in cell wall biosynthesis
MLKAIGYEVHVAVFHSKQRKDGGLERSRCLYEEQNGIFVHRLFPAIRSETPIIQDFLSEVYFLLEQLHRQFQFRLFHGFFINETGFLTTLLAKEWGVPVINSVRGSDLHKHLFSPKQQGQLTWVLANSDWVTFVSEALMKRGIVLVPELRDRAVAFWNSIQPVDFTALPTPPQCEHLKGTVIASTGRFRDKKGLEILLAACATLAPKRELTLLLVGDYAEREKTYWQQQVAESGIQDRVILTGMVDRATALAYLPSVDIFAVPSLHDGCPNALLEAMLAGKAIVGSQVDAIGEILRDGENGLVVPPGDSIALAQALERLAQNLALRQTLGQAAQKTALTELSPEREQSHWAHIYAQMLTSPQENIVPLSA